MAKITIKYENFFTQTLQVLLVCKGMEPSILIRANMSPSAPLLQGAHQCQLFVKVRGMQPLAGTWYKVYCQSNAVSNN